MPTVKLEPPEHDTRARIVAASAELFRHHGYAGTGMKAIVEASAAPYGSIYHHFPGGKEELGVAALEAGGVTYRELVELIFAEGVDVVDATRAFCEGAAAVLEMTDYADACPIATMALEVSSSSEPMRIAACGRVRVVARRPAGAPRQCRDRRAESARTGRRALLRDRGRVPPRPRPAQHGGVRRDRGKHGGTGGECARPLT